MFEHVPLIRPPYRLQVQWYSYMHTSNAVYTTVDLPEPVITELTLLSWMIINFQYSNSYEMFIFGVFKLYSLAQISRISVRTDCPVCRNARQNACKHRSRPSRHQRLHSVARFAYSSGISQHMLATSVLAKAEVKNYLVRTFVRMVFRSRTELSFIFICNFFTLRTTMYYIHYFEHVYGT